MHPRMTHRQAEAHDAFEHIFASAGALAFINAYAGSAALPAPYNALAARQLACPCSHSSTLEEITHDTCRSRSLCLVLTGLTPNMMSASRRLTPQNVHTSSSSTPPRPLTRGAPHGARGSLAHPWPCVSNSTKALWSLPGASMTFWSSSPSIPEAGAVSRSLHAQPGQRRPDGRRPPARTAAHPSRQAAASGRRAPPCAPSHSSSSTVAVWSVTQCGSPTACPVPSRTLFHVLPWLQEQDTTIFCDFLRRWPTSRRRNSRVVPPLQPSAAPHVRSAAVIAQRLQAIKSATPPHHR